MRNMTLTKSSIFVAWLGIVLTIAVSDMRAMADGVASDYPMAIKASGTFSRYVFTSPQSVTTVDGVKHDNVSEFYADENGLIVFAVKQQDTVVSGQTPSTIQPCPDGQVKFGGTCVNFGQPDGSGSVGSALSVPLFLNFELVQDENGEFKYVNRGVTQAPAITWNDQNAPTLQFNDQVLDLGNAFSPQASGG